MNIQEEITYKLTNHQSVVSHVVGFYISVGNQFSPSLHIPIFDFIEHSRHNTIVLADCLGTAMWINVHPTRVLTGGKALYMAKNIQRKLESIKNVTSCN